MTIIDIRLKIASSTPEQRTSKGRLNRHMAISKENAVENARKDLANRLKIDAGDVKEKAVEDADFPDMALGASEEDEMSGQMMTRGWRIRLASGADSYEYRADKNQLRLYKYKGKNYRI